MTYAERMGIDVRYHNDISIPDFVSQYNWDTTMISFYRETGVPELFEQNIVAIWRPKK